MTVSVCKQERRILRFVTDPRPRRFVKTPRIGRSFRSSLTQRRLFSVDRTEGVGGWNGSYHLSEIP